MAIWKYFFLPTFLLFIYSLNGEKMTTTTWKTAAELGRINNNTTDSILNMHKNVTVVSKETEDVINLVNMTTGNSTFLGEISINTPINNVSNLLGQNLTTISDASTTTPMMGTISLEKAKEDQTEPDMENDDYNLANEEEIVEKQQKQKPVQGNQADKDSTDKQAMNEFMASSEESHVFLYLIVLVLLLALLYLIGQNRKKIIGCVLEGRNHRNSKGSGRYRRLPNDQQQQPSLEDAALEKA